MHYTMLLDIDNRNAVDILYQSGLNVTTVAPLCQYTGPMDGQGGKAGYRSPTN